MATTSLKQFSQGAPIKVMGNETKPETKQNMFMEDFIKRPARSLIGRPATRFGEMVGTLGMKGADFLSGGKVNKYFQEKKGMTLDQALEYASEQDVDIPGFGTVKKVQHRRRSQ